MTGMSGDWASVCRLSCPFCPARAAYVSLRASPARSDAVGPVTRTRLAPLWRLPESQLTLASSRRSGSAWGRLTGIISLGFGKPAVAFRPFGQHDARVVLGYRH